MEFKNTPYFSVGRASDLTGGDRILYRFLEMIPGILSWGTIIGVIVASYFTPVAAAYFIIAFDLYWLLKTVYMSVHHRHNWRRLRHNMSVDWKEKVKNLKYEHLYHMVLLPFYDESYEVIEGTIKSLLATHYKKNRMIIVLAAEERAGSEAQENALHIKEKYAEHFKHFLITTHPSNLPGEMPGKGSNIAYSAEQARVEILDPNDLKYEDVIVSAFDVDTVVREQYFLCLTWHFLTADDPSKVSFQPVPLYNNNLWSAPAVSRVTALSSTFWQMIQQERPEKLVTFSSHSVTFKQLYEIGYWQKNMVSEDSRIFWNLYLANDGDYKVIPISYPVSMDANVAPTFLQTVRNIYKQHRRWMWGVENLPYMLMGFIKNKKIPLKAKIHHTFVQLEGFWSLATNPILILLLGWLPLILGGREFNDSVLAYNLPIVTRNLMVAAMFGLVLLAVISLTLLPPQPKGVKNAGLKKASIVVQWVFVPLTIIIFGAIPGLDAQTRLLLGKYMGFWVTPKHRS